MALTEQQRERLAELRAADAERETKEQEAADERELEARELAVLLEGKGLKGGVDFKVIANSLGGVFAVKKPDTRAIRNWENAGEKQKLSLEWQIGLIRHYIIEPDDKAAGKALLWAQTCAQRPGLCWQTSNAFVELMGVDIESVQKKA